jgi:hypothetical protein
MALTPILQRYNYAFLAEIILADGKSFLHIAIAPPLPLCVPILISTGYAEIHMLTIYWGIEYSVISVSSNGTNPSSVRVNSFNKFKCFGDNLYLMS